MVGWLKRVIRVDRTGSWSRPHKQIRPRAKCACLQNLCMSAQVTTSQIAPRPTGNSVGCPETTRGATYCSCTRSATGIIPLMNPRNGARSTPCINTPTRPPVRLQSPATPLPKQLQPQPPLPSRSPVRNHTQACRLQLSLSPAAPRSSPAPRAAWARP